MAGLGGAVRDSGCAFLLTAGYGKDHPMKGDNGLSGKREYPTAPIVGVGAAVFRGNAVLLVQRGQAPLAGEWSLPGGAVELGETLEEAIRREVAEETGLRIAPVLVLKTFDHIERDANGHVQFHYVLVDFLCRLEGARSGGKLGGADSELRPATDVSDARWVPVDGLRNSKEFPLRPKALDVIEAAWEEARKIDLRGVPL